MEDEPRIQSMSSFNEYSIVPSSHCFMSSLDFVYPYQVSDLCQSLSGFLWISCDVITPPVADFTG